MKRRLHAIDQLRQSAQRRLPRLALRVARRRLRGNVDAFTRMRLTPRALAGNVTRDLAVELLGTRYALPFGIATDRYGWIYLAGIRYRPRARRRGRRYSLCPVHSRNRIDRADRRARAVSRLVQLYVGRDEAITRDLIARAKAVASPVLVVTVDVPAPGKRVRDLANGFRVAVPSDAANIVRYGLSSRLDRGDGAGRCAALRQSGNAMRVPDSGAGSLAQLMASQSSARLDWAELARIRTKWGGKLIVKGIIDPEDAKTCGCRGRGTA